MRERPLHRVPVVVYGLLGLSLAAQLVWHSAQPPLDPRAQALPNAPTVPVTRLAALGDDAALSRVLSLWLQAFDNQSGVSVPFSSLDFSKVEAWLTTISELDPRSQYPFLAASRVYASVHDPERKKRMLEFVYRHFGQDPNQRWPWLAHVSIVARHQLKDLPLALKYAKSITEHASGPQVPGWARDMGALLLADMGEARAARVLIGGLIDSGRVTDEHELNFLLNRLAELEAQPGGKE